jgi:dimethylargininase
MHPEKISYALVRKPSPKYAAHYAPRGINISDERTSKQHDAYVSALQRAGVVVTTLPPHPIHHDCIFIEDTAVLFKHRALITRMNDVRNGEQREVEEWLRDKFEIVHPPPDARIEGGDVLHLDEITLVGRSERTNDAGIEALRQFMEPLGHPVRAIPVTRCLHLKSAITCLGDRTVLVTPQWLNAELPGNYDRIETDPSEPHAANALRINDLVLLSTAFPQTAARVRHFAAIHNLQTIQIDISETQKGDGALTCQSILW